MATFYVNGSASSNGDGSINSPYNAVPSNTLTAGNTWLFDRAGILNMGGATLSSGNNVIMGAYGSGSGLPKIIGAADLWSCATATSPILIEDIHFIRNAAAGGVGVRASQLSGGSASFTMRNSIIEGFTSSFNGDRSLRVTITGTRFIGPSNSFGVLGTATSGNNCDDWALLGNTFDVGGATLLSTSTSTSTTGAWNRLRILGNRFNSSTANDINLGMPTSQSDSTKYLRVTAPSTIEMFTDAGATTPSNLPAWAPGSTVFLAGFSNRANFGLFTVSSVTTNALVVTETSLQTEAIGQNKGIHLRDATRAFLDVLIDGNVISSPGATPMNLNGIRGLVARGNRISGGRGVGKVSASIETINVLGGLVESNDIRDMFVSIGVQTVDGMGIMFDGASEDCIGRDNYVAGLTPTTTATPNSAAAFALFESKNCKFQSGVAERCHRGLWVGGPGTTGSARQLTLNDCTRGYEVNASPAAASIALRNSIVQGCDETGVNNATATIDSVTYFSNSSGSALGTNALTTDPKLAADLRPLADSPSLTNGADLGYVRGMGLVQGRKVRGAYAAAVLRKAI